MIQKHSFHMHSMNYRKLKVVDHDWRACYNMILSTWFYQMNIMQCMHVHTWLMGTCMHVWNWNQISQVNQPHKAMMHKHNNNYRHERKSLETSNMHIYVTIHDKPIILCTNTFWTMAIIINYSSCKCKFETTETYTCTQTHCLLKVCGPGVTW